MQGIPGNQNDANYGAGNYRPHKNSHHYDNWTDSNPKWNKYQKREEKGGKGSTKGKGGKGKYIPPVDHETTTDSMYIPGIDQSQQISAKTGETADKSDQNPEIAGGNHNPKQNRKGKGKGKGEHQDPNAGWKNPMQVYTATPKEKQDTNTINQPTPCFIERAEQQDERTERKAQKIRRKAR